MNTSSIAITAAPTLTDAEAHQVLRRAAWRLIPLLGLAYIAAYLDRVNVSFAALQMNQDLHLGAVAYGTGAGIFFLGYVMFEIPSNLLLQRVGPRRWISRIMVSWGCVSMAMVMVRGENSFYLLRFLLGVAEAGFFPGVVLYLTYWFPEKERARVIALFATATALAGLIGSPLSGMILAMDGMGGLRGWHWLFVLEGLPAIVLGLLVLHLLPDGPTNVPWLTPAERRWLTDTLDRERNSRDGQRQHTLRQALTSARVWRLGLVYLCMVIGMYGIALWLPQILRTMTSANDLTIGLLAALPFLAATIGMVVIGWHSDHRHERRWHVAASFALAAAGCTVAAVADSLATALLGLSIAAIGIWAVMGPFWALATSFLVGTAAAGGIALINSLGNIGGFAGPYLMGWFRQSSAGYAAGLVAVAVILVVGGLLALTCRPAGSLRR